MCSLSAVFPPGEDIKWILHVMGILKIYNCMMVFPCRKVIKGKLFHRIRQLQELNSTLVLSIAELAIRDSRSNAFNSGY